MPLSFEFEGLNSLRSAMDGVPKKIDDAAKDWVLFALADVAKFASKHHRYKAKTGQLDKAYGASRKGPAGSTPKVRKQVRVTFGLLFLVRSKNSTPYSRAIHEGHGTWKPDRFVDRAVRKRKARLQTMGTVMVVRALEKQGF